MFRPTLHRNIDGTYIESILTDMKLIHVKLTDEQADLLAAFPNQSEIVRQAIEMYIGGIRTDTFKGIKETYLLLYNLSKDMDSKLDYIARKVQD